MYKIISLISWIVLAVTSIRAWNISSDLFKIMKVFPTLIVIDNLFILVRRLEKRCLKNVFAYFGRKSFVIYLIHQPFFCALLGNVLRMVGLGIFSTCLICFISGVAVPLVTVHVLKKNSITKKVCILLGLE